jgi:hypothetical protein
VAWNINMGLLPVVGQSANPSAGSLAIATAVAQLIAGSQLAPTTGAIALAGQAPSLAGSGLPAAPADLWMALQGQTTAGATASAPAPINANSQTIAWLAVSGATSYNVYRSVNGGAESLYASGISTTSYTDSAATGCVNGTAGPVAGVYYGANSYRYRVSAVNGSGEGPKTSTGQKYYVYNFGKGGTNTANVQKNGVASPAGGFKWWGDFGGPTTTNYADTGANETGEAWLNTPSGGSDYILPVCGGIYTQWNMWIGSIGNGFLYLDIYLTNATTVLTMHGEIVGDLVISITGTQNADSNLNLPSYIVNGPATSGAWFTYKVPIAAFMTPQSGWGAGAGSSSSINILQHQVYKFLIKLAGGATAAYRLDNVYYGE